MYCNYLAVSSKTNEPSIIRCELGTTPIMVSMRFVNWQLYSFKCQLLTMDELGDVLSTDNKITFAQWGHAMYPELRKLFGYFYRQVLDVPGEYMLADHHDMQFAADMFRDLGKFRQRLLDHPIYHYHQQAEA